MSLASLASKASSVVENLMVKTMAARVINLRKIRNLMNTNHVLRKKWKHKLPNSNEPEVKEAGGKHAIFATNLMERMKNQCGYCMSPHISKSDQ